MLGSVPAPARRPHVIVTARHALSTAGTDHPACAGRGLHGLRAGRPEKYGYVGRPANPRLASPRRRARQSEKKNDGIDGRTGSLP